MEKTITIIIPIHNGEGWLNRCLDSLVAQTDQDFEVIAVLDRCTDNSKQIALSYRKRLRGLRIYECELGRPGAARNVGLVNANTEQIAFLDCDDYYLPHAIEKMKADLCEKPVVTHKVLMQDEGTNVLRERNFFDNTAWLFGNTYNLQWLRENSIRFNYVYYGYEDSDFNKQVMESLCRADDNFTIRYNDENPFYVQVVNRKSITHKKDFHAKCKVDYSTLWRFAKSGVTTPNYLYLAQNEFIAKSMSICYCAVAGGITWGDLRYLVDDSKIIRNELPLPDYERFKTIYGVISANTSEERKRSAREWGKKYEKEARKMFRDTFAPQVFRGWNKPITTIMNELELYK